MNFQQPDFMQIITAASAPSATSSYTYSRSLYQPSDYPDLPPGLLHAVDFLHHFFLFFVFPIAIVLLSAYIAASIAASVYRKFFAPYATPDELLQDALMKLEKYEPKKGDGGDDGGGGGGGSTKNKNRRMYSIHRRRRENALETLRLVISLRPDMMKSYIVLASELFYGDINNGSPGSSLVAGESSNMDEGYQQGRRNNTNNSNSTLRRRRGGQQEQQTSELQSQSKLHHDAKNNNNNNNNLSPALMECQDIVERGLKIDGTNQPLLKLQNELQLVKKYGRNGPHAKMMNIGSFGWMRA